MSDVICLLLGALAGIILYQRLKLVDERLLNRATTDVLKAFTRSARKEIVLSDDELMAGAVDTLTLRFTQQELVRLAQLTELELNTWVEKLYWEVINRER